VGGGVGRALAPLPRVLVAFTPRWPPYPQPCPWVAPAIGEPAWPGRHPLPSGSAAGPRTPPPLLEVPSCLRDTYVPIASPSKLPVLALALPVRRLSILRTTPCLVPSNAAEAVVYWMLSLVCCLLSIGYWLLSLVSLSLVYWLLAIGYWLLAIVYCLSIGYCLLSIVYCPAMAIDYWLLAILP
jgi:hypothetical protein